MLSMVMGDDKMLESAGLHGTKLSDASVGLHETMLSDASTGDNVSTGGLDASDTSDDPLSLARAF